eukprot:Clim_evm1s230 gene=Clim_evmTU1s230
MSAPKVKAMQKVRSLLKINRSIGHPAPVEPISKRNEANSLDLSVTSVTKISESSSIQSSNSIALSEVSLDAEFNEYMQKGKAATSGTKIAKIAAKKGGVSKLLKAYAYYKQATDGPAPRDMDLSKLKGRDRKMKEAWVELGDMDQETAKRSYIEHVKIMLGEKSSHTSSMNTNSVLPGSPNSDGTQGQTPRETSSKEPWSGIRLTDGTIQAEPTVHDADLQERFEAVADVVAEHGISYHAMRNGRVNFLQTFALFKQATEGDVPDEMPTEDLNLVDVRILPFWQRLSGMSEEVAKVEYIKFVQRTHFDKQSGGAQHSSTPFVDVTLSSEQNTTCVTLQYPMKHIVHDDGTDSVLSTALLDQLKANGEEVNVIDDLGVRSKSDSKLLKQTKQKLQTGSAVYYFVSEQTDLAALTVLAKACVKKDCILHLVVGQQGLGVLEAVDHFEKLTETNVDLKQRETQYKLGLGAISCLAEQMVLKMNKDHGLRYRVYRLGLILCNQKGQLYPGTSALRLLHFADHHREQLGANGAHPLLVDGTMYPLVVEDAVEQVRLLSHASNLDNQAFHISGATEIKISEFLNIFANTDGQGPKFVPSDEDRAMLELKLGLNQKSHFEPIEQMIQLGDPRGLLNCAFGIPYEAGVMYGGPVSEVQVRSARTKEIINSIAAVERQETFVLSSLAPALWLSFQESASAVNGQVLPTLPRYVSDRVCIVTGASSGIGRALALALARANAKVVICARRVEELEALKFEILKINGHRPDRVLLVRCDVTEEKDCDNLVQQTIERFGTVHVLFNNAGRSIFRPFADQVDRSHDFARLMAVNYLGPANLMLKVVPIMRAQRFGAVINVNSEVVNTGAKWFGCYAATKSALKTLSSSVSAEARVDNVLVSDVHLPLVETGMVSDIVESFSTPWSGVHILKQEQAVESCLSVLTTGFRDVHPSSIGQVGVAFRTHMPRFMEYYWSTRIPF